MSSVFTIFLVLGLLISVVGILTQLFLALAVHYDCKEKRIENATMWTLLTFFFGWIPAIIYICTRNNAKKQEFADQEINEVTINNYKSKSKTFLILFIVFYIVTIIGAAVIGGVAFTTGMRAGLDSDLEGIIGGQFDNDYLDGLDDEDFFTDNDDFFAYYYDREGNSYDDVQDVVFYSNDGKKYYFSDDQHSYTDDDGTLYEVLRCFVDEEGYFYFDKDNKLEFSKEKSKYVDSDGKTYDSIIGTYWDEFGQMQNANVVD